MRPRHVAALILGLTLSVTACGSSTSPRAGSTTTAATTIPAVVTTTVAPPTTVPPKAIAGAPSSASAASDLVAAWNNHDRNAAAKVADAEAVDGIFATPDPAMWLRGCTTDDGLGEGGCIYLTEKGAVQINTEKRQNDWVVTSAQWGVR